ncbi:MAG: hypothetical protein U0871_10050 [Gemmataceae bacterium]
MSFGRLLLAAATAAYLGWLGWLGYAVYVARWTDKPPVVSRAQLVAATHLVVADVTAGPDGLPAPAAAVAEVLRGDGLSPGASVEVLNLPAAVPPGAGVFPGSGKYLLPLVGDGKTFRVAGLPRSPGYEPASPTRPAIYRWDAGTQAQLRSLGLVP